MTGFTARLRQYADVMKTDYSIIVSDELNEAANLIDQQADLISKQIQGAAYLEEVISQKEAEANSLRAETEYWRLRCAKGATK